MKKLLLILCIFLSVPLFAQKYERVELLPLGDCEQWVSRYIRESALLGGETKLVYVMAPTDTIRKNAPFDYSKTPWGISNAYANVMGVEKAACTAGPERRDDGYAARLDTRLVTVKVLGLLNIKVIIAGTLYFGEVLEPVTSAKDPYGCVEFGKPFTGKPKALVFDVKANVSPKRSVMRAMGFSCKSFSGHDEPQIFMYLQHRWEDEAGNIYAKRVGTIYHRIKKSIPEWENDYTLEVFYGDMTGHPDYDPVEHGLMPTDIEYRARNSKGELVPIREVGWAGPDVEPTHMMLMFSSGCYEAFVGTPGNTLWVDNIRLAY